MASLKLTVACGDYEIIRALREGTVKADGLDLTFLTSMYPPEYMGRMSRGHEFDVCEFGLNYLISAVVKGNPTDGIIGLPVFPHRRFRHGFVFVNNDAGIRVPKDLIGKCVGSNWGTTSNVWLRGILQDHYDVPYRDVKWVGESYATMSESTPKWQEVLRPGEELQHLLAEGKLVAAMSPEVPSLVQRKDKRIGVLFGNAKEEELKYFRATGIFPIMHVMVIKREIVEKYPWVSTNLIKAFEESKRAAFRRLINPRVVPLAFYRDTWEEQEAIMGTDPWAYGLGDANRKNVATHIRYMVEQEMLEREVPVDDMFAPFDLKDVTPEGWY